MGNFKEIFKILLIIQLIAFTLAYHRHPDAETIDFVGSSIQQSQEDAILKAAMKSGNEAVIELLRTRKPVTRTETTPDGYTTTTTYQFDDDGSISKRTSTTRSEHYVYNSAKLPDSKPINELHKSPTGSVTRTFTDAEGNKVTQTIAIDNTKPATALKPDEFTDDWFNKPFPSWSDASSYEPPLPSHWLPDFDKLATYGHRTFTRIITGPNGEKRVLQTVSNSPPSASEQPKRPKFPPIGDINWPTLDEPSFGKPWDNPNANDSDDWVVVENNPDVETSTKKKFPYWTPRTWDWPEFTTPTTTTTTTKTKVFIEPESNTPKPLPSLNDFLKSQYGPSTSTTIKTQTFGSTTRATTTTPAATAPTTTKNPTFINIEDLPVVQVLHNGQPANDSILKSLPPHLTPTMSIEQVLNVDHKHPIEEEIEVLTPKVETNIRTFSKTLTGPQKPSLKDLDPSMQEVLRKAGINPEDITNIEGDTITKTRTEPDGRVITTTYKVNSVPVEHTLPAPHYTPPQFTSHSFESFKPFGASRTPLTPFAANLTPISEFLAKLGLTKFDISSRNGRYTKTLIDDNGDVLTATFVLSSPRDINVSEPPKPKPYK